MGNVVNVEGESVWCDVIWGGMTEYQLLMSFDGMNSSSWQSNMCASLHQIKLQAAIFNF